MKISIPGPKLEQVTVFFQVNKLLSGKKEGLGSGLLLQRTELKKKKLQWDTTTHPSECLQFESIKC